MIPVETRIEDNEVLYRRVDYKPDEEYWKVDAPTGLLLVEPAAFRDPDCTPSVDRANLCNNDPAWTQKDDNNSGIIFLVAREARTDEQMREIITNSNPPVPHVIDVIHRPEPDNYAHAQIEATPPVKKNTFRRLRAALSNIANRHIHQEGWLIRPLGYRE